MKYAYAGKLALFYFFHHPEETMPWVILFSLGGQFGMLAGMAVGEHEARTMPVNEAVGRLVEVGPGNQGWWW